MATRTSSPSLARLIPKLLLLNFLLTLLIFLGRWLPVFGSRKEILAVAIYFSTLVAVGFVSRRFRVLEPALVLWNASHFTLVLIVYLVEILFLISPRAIPHSLAKFNPTLLYPETKKSMMVEYLEDLPWVKFKPNTFIVDRKYRGDDFTGAWKTDFLGFKNIPQVAHIKQLTAISVGDSFVEGMGVPLSETWTTLVSRAGFPTYNMGVQSFAPSQAIAMFKMFENQFRYRYVFFGYLPGFEKRELNLPKRDEILNHQTLAGGIGDQIRAESNAYLFFKVTNSFVDLIQSRLSFLMNQMTAESRKRSRENTLDPRSPFHPYYDELISHANERCSENDEQFVLAREAMMELKGFVEAKDAKFVVILFVPRSISYYELAMGSKPAGDHCEQKIANFIRQFCAERGIDLIDIEEGIHQYLEKLRSEGRLRTENLPYFRFDVHMNENGQRLVAGRVIAYLRTEAGISAA